MVVALSGHDADLHGVILLIGFIAAMVIFGSGSNPTPVCLLIIYTCMFPCGFVTSFFGAGGTFVGIAFDGLLLGLVIAAIWPFIRKTTGHWLIDVD
jgi:hypothetical protein